MKPRRAEEPGPWYCGVALLDAAGCGSNLNLASFMRLSTSSALACSSGGGSNRRGFGSDERDIVRVVCGRKALQL